MLLLERSIPSMTKAEAEAYAWALEGVETFADEPDGPGTLAAQIEDVTYRLTEQYRDVNEGEIGFGITVQKAAALTAAGERANDKMLAFYRGKEVTA